MSEQEVDVLAIGPHPDDIELFCGGTLISLAARGHTTAAVDFTRGELATSGTPEERAKEAAASASIMGLSHRENLGLPDGRIHPLAGLHEDDEQENNQLKSVVSALRRLRPKLVLIPHAEGRHPDHSATSGLAERAIFFAGLRQFKTEDGAERHVCTQVAYYFMRFTGKPSFIVDTTDAFEKKVKAIECYKSQITRSPAERGRETLINSPRTVSTIDARDQFYGAMIGKTHGEPFVIKNALAIPDPLTHFTTNSTANALLFPGAL